MLKAPLDSYVTKGDDKDGSGRLSLMAIGRTFCAAFCTPERIGTKYFALLWWAQSTD